MVFQMTIERETPCFHYLNSPIKKFMLNLSSEFPQLKDQLYLDHSGATLPSKYLLDNWKTEVSENVYGNPHSANSPASAAATHRINEIRSRIKR
jgi:selenocysteine lyase/cysteine desulfurase